MTTFGQKLDNAAAGATCQALQTGGAALIGYGAVGLAAGGTGVVPIAAGSLALLAANLGCTWDPNQPGPGEPTPDEQFCYEGASDFQIRSLFNGNVTSDSTPVIRKLTDVVYVETETDLNNDTYNVYRFEWVQSNGVSGTTSLREGGGTVNTWVLRQDFVGDPTCQVPGPEPEPVDIPPYEYTDPDDGCQLTVNLKGFQQDPTGAINPVFKIEPSADELLRADGGVISGCNFSPVIYTGGPPGGGQPPQYRPWNPDWDNPGGGLSPWQDFLNDLAGSLISNLLYDALSDLYATPLPPANYKLLAPCEADSEGNRLEVEVQIPSLPTNIALATRIEALIPILQGQKDFKQPICPPVKPEGEFRTIGFISEEVSPNGKSCLRKRLRYRSKSGLGLDSVIDWWKDFQFNAGPVTVKHRGSSWGTITVWAASADEGKRVIRHAAGEAGFDADQVGRWEISGSSSSRLGMPGTMKVNQTGGYYWITARDGSDNRPLVGKT